MENEDRLNTFRQEMEDLAFEHDAKREAFDMFTQTLQNPLGICIPVPRRVLLMQYYPAISKYSSEDYKRIRNEEFNRLKEEHGK